MSFSTGEAVIDVDSGKWAFVIKWSDGSIMTKSKHIYDTKEKAEIVIIEILHSLGEYAKHFNK